MLHPSDLHDYQKRAIKHQTTNACSMLWLDMGLGKTAVTLTSIAHLIKTGALRSVLIVAPLRPLRLVWRQEALKWSHTAHLTFSLVSGTPDQRSRALARKADVYLINNENLKWLGDLLKTRLLSKGKELPFDGIVWDEVSKMKNSTTKRAKAMLPTVSAMKWMTGLTGTPASNGYIDLHGQYLVVDKGQRLGISKTNFVNTYYFKEGLYKMKPHSFSLDEIKEKISDITLEMSAEEYNKLPDMVVNDVLIEFGKDLRHTYDTMEKEFFLQLDKDNGLELFNKGSLTNKCLQFSQGAVYLEAGKPEYHVLHDLKLEALDDIIDSAQGNPVLCSYAYKSDAARIMERFKLLKPVNLTECNSDKKLKDAMAYWKSGDCRLMIGHPACLGAGVEVLTENRGWVKITDVLQTEKVFDGVEYVTHSGCIYSGYEKTIDLFGITMTPNHKILVNGEWKEARHVQDTEENKRKSLYEWETPSDRGGRMFTMWKDSRADTSECRKVQSSKVRTLFSLHRGNVSPTYRIADMENLVRSQESCQRLDEQKLRRSRDNYGPRMEMFQKVLRRHVGKLCRWVNDRTYQQQPAVLSHQLSLGNQHGTTKEQTKQSVFGISGRKNPFGGIGSSIGVFQNHAYETVGSGDVRGRSSGELQAGSLREKSRTEERPEETKAHVYDLVDCGPRNRFLIRNKDGEVFISHNSMGHGIDGLQDGGSTLVWFGLTWSLDLYSQFNARIRRQGQKKAVVCHRIFTKDTLDQAQALAIGEKAVGENSLRKSLNEYRRMKYG